MKKICLFLLLIAFISCGKHANSSQVEGELSDSVESVQRKKAVIDDPDGYVNVRQKATRDSKIVAKIVDGEVFYYKVSDSDWWEVSETPNGRILGYIHSSRIKPISEESDDNEAVSQLPSGLYPVDLGLSVCWANYNLGADCEEGTGDYFAWGEIKSKTTFSEKSYKWAKVGANGEMIPTKYIIDDPEGTSTQKSDGKTKLQSADDAATKIWSSDWRLPTETEMKELKQRCTWLWGVKDGVVGYQVTGPSGNSIFLPAVGFASGDDVYSVGKSGYYWSSSVSEDYVGSSMALNIRERKENKSDPWKTVVGQAIHSHERYKGYTIRPVMGN